MNEMQRFNFRGFPVRTLQDKNGEPWFAAKDITDILGYHNSSKAIADHVDDGDKLNNETLSSLGQRGGWLINESGLYSLILSSKLPTAQEFKHWVTSEVLPQIRKTGGYIPAGKEEDPQAIMARAVLIAQKTIADQKHQLEAQKPKVLFADALTVSRNSILVGELAKILRQNGVQIGATRLFSWLREHKYLSSRKGEDWNMPTQKSMEARLFEIKTSSHSAPDGSLFTTRTPKVTGKGQQYFVNKFLQHQELTKEAW